MAGKSWKTTSGLPENFEMTIEECWFGKGPGENPNPDNAFAIIRGDGFDHDAEEDLEQNQIYYSLGKDWKADKRGTVAVHARGKDQFSNMSNWGRFIDSLIEIGQEQPELLDELEERGETYEASTFTGLKFRFERKNFSYTVREGEDKGQQREYSVALPVEFLGVDEGGKKKPAAKATAAKGRGRAKAEDDDDGGEEEEAPKPTRTRTAAKKPAAKPTAKRGAKKTLRDEVVAFAADYEDSDDGFSAFVADVFDAETFDRADEVEGDEELSNEILDPDGIFAEAHA